MDTGGDSWWPQVNAPELLGRRGFGPRKVRLARRFYNGQTASWEFLPTLMRLGSAYDPYTSFPVFLRQMVAERRNRPRAAPHHFNATQLAKDWTVMDRLGEIEAPTLVIAGHEDFLFPPEHQEQLAAGIPDARLHIVDRAGHNPHDERTDEVMTAVADFLTE
jgi:proline iminopeptidase